MKCFEGSIFHASKWIRRSVRINCIKLVQMLFFMVLREESSASQAIGGKRGGWKEIKVRRALSAAEYGETSDVCGKWDVRQSANTIYP